MQVAQATFEGYSCVRRFLLSGVAEGVTRRLTSFFGCRHREMSRPFTRQRETYRVCLHCGARRQFNPPTWETKGGYYYPAASTDGPAVIEIEANSGSEVGR